MNDDGLQSHRATGALDPERDFTAVGNQDLVEHYEVPAGRIRNSGWPASISSPLFTRMASTVPDVSATTPMKVFIASMTQMFWPASMLAPTSTSGGAPGAAA